VFVGRLDEAGPEVDAALATHRRLLGEQHDETLADLSTRALLLRERLDWPAAEQAYREVSEQRRRIHGDEAEAIQTEVLATARRVLGNDHNVTLIALNNLGVNYSRQGRFEEAEPLYLEELAASRRIVGSEHREVHVSITNLGRLYLRMERFEDAERQLREAVELGRRVLDPGNYGMGISLQAWGDSLVGLGRHAEAEPALLEAWEIMLPLLGEDRGGMKRVAGSLAEVYRVRGDTRQAETWARRATG
jgi:tetratricopeptide (TPR) repeat protein